MKSILGEFAVEYLQVLDENGKADELLMPEMPRDDMLKMYQYMVLTRALDGKMFKLQRQGRIGTVASSLGQEAAAVGSAFALSKDDWVFPSFREHGVHVVRGYPLHQYIQYWGGDERGAKVPEGVNIFTIAVPVASQIPHAVGFAWAMKLQNKPVVSAAYFGDGATSRGDFHEGMNFAGTFRVPCVFVCQNNQWAISLPVSRQTAAHTLAQKAIAYGFSGMRVDGNDVFAVYKAMKEAVENARKGEGPTLIECLTYRISDHTTSDDAKRYRDAKTTEEWKKKDPIVRLEKYLLAQGALSDGKIAEIKAMAEHDADVAAKMYESIPKPDPHDMFSYVYAEQPEELRDQEKEMQ